MSFFQMPSPAAARRWFIGQSGLVLSGAAVALLAGKESLAATAAAAAPQDVQILNTALGAELEAIAAYQLGAESKLLQKPVLELAITFQGHHKEHAELLVKTIQKLGGKAVAAKANYNFPAEQLKSQADVLRFAAKLEQGAVSAYLGAVHRTQVGVGRGTGRRGVGRLRADRRRLRSGCCRGRSEVRRWR